MNVLLGSALMYEPGHTRGQVPELAFRVSCWGGYQRMAQDATRQQPVSNLYQKTSQLLERIGAYFRGYLPLRSDDGLGPQCSSQRRHCSRKTASAASGEATAGNWRRHWLSRSCGYRSKPRATSLFRRRHTAFLLIRLCRELSRQLVES